MSENGATAGGGRCVVHFADTCINGSNLMPFVCHARSIHQAFFAWWSRAGLG